MLSGSVDLLARKPTEFLLGPTGLTGISSSNGIQVTNVEKGSPADGKIEKGSLIIGAGGDAFQGDIRAALASAINAAETEKADGKLELLLKGANRVTLQLDVLGSYSETAPYNCPKSDLIIERAAQYLAAQIEEELDSENRRSRGTFNSGATHSALLGLMATGEKKYIELVARAIKASDYVNPDPEILTKEVTGEKPSGYVGWYWGYHCILLGEYYMLTKDESVLPALKAYAVSLAKGQDAGGLWGHRMAIRNGRLPGYAQMNQSSLSCFMGMLMAKKCGIDDPALDAGIEKTYTYYETYIGKGGFNYGVHGPNQKAFNNNGMSGSAAICMALLDNDEGTRFFSRLSATAHDNLEQGHASNFFNPLWTPLAANLSGPEVSQQFFRNASWANDTYRAWDGSFRRAGGNERGKEGSQTGVALLTYCLPRKALFITGREADTTLWLEGKEATKVVGMGQVDYSSKSTQELLAMFNSPYPQVRIRAVWALRDREPEFIPKLVHMMDSGNKLQRESAIEYFGYKCPPEQAHPQIKTIVAILRNKNEDVELRATAASTLAAHGEAAYGYYDDLLQLIVDEEPGDHFRDIDQSVGRSLNMLCSTPYASGLVRNKELFYAAADKLLDHKRQQARSDGIKMLSEIPLKDFPKMANQIMYIIEDKDPSYHSYHAWQHTIGPAIEILANLNIAEGIAYATGVLDREGGKWGFKVRMLCAALPKYGANAKDALAKVQADERLKNVENDKFRNIWLRMVQAIEEDTTSKKLITIEEALKMADG